MTEDDKKSQDEYIKALTEVGSPTRPIHVKLNSWDEETHRLQDNILSQAPFQGKWQSYIKDYRLYIPEQLQYLFSAGGVLTVSTEKHLLLFGSKHWSLMQRTLAKETGISPVHNEVARHYYSNMASFNKLNDDGTIDIPISLIQYAGLQNEIALIGMMYFAEIHDKKAYLDSERLEKQESKLSRFRKINFK